MTSLKLPAIVITTTKSSTYGNGSGNVVFTSSSSSVRWTFADESREVSGGERPHSAREAGRRDVTRDTTRPHSSHGVRTTSSTLAVTSDARDATNDVGRPHDVALAERNEATSSRDSAARRPLKQSKSRRDSLITATLTPQHSLAAHTPIYKSYSLPCSDVSDAVELEREPQPIRLALRRVSCAGIGGGLVGGDKSGGSFAREKSGKSKKVGIGIGGGGRNGGRDVGGGGGGGGERGRGRRQQVVERLVGGRGVVDVPRVIISENEFSGGSEPTERCQLLAEFYERIVGPESRILSEIQNLAEHVISALYPLLVKLCEKRPAPNSAAPNPSSTGLKIIDRREELNKLVVEKCSIRARNGLLGFGNAETRKTLTSSQQVNNTSGHNGNGVNQDKESREAVGMKKSGKTAKPEKVEEEDWDLLPDDDANLSDKNQEIYSLDVLVTFEPPHDIRTVSPGAGYLVIPLDTVPEQTEVNKGGGEGRGGEEGGGVGEGVEYGKVDRWRFGRSTDGTYLSPLVVCQSLYAVVEQAIRAAYTSAITSQLDSSGGITNIRRENIRKEKGLDDCKLGQGQVQGQDGCSDIFWELLPYSIDDGQAQVSLLLHGQLNNKQKSVTNMNAKDELLYTEDTRQGKTGNFLESNNGNSGKLFSTKDEKHSVVTSDVKRNDTKEKCRQDLHDPSKASDPFQCRINLLPVCSSMSGGWGASGQPPPLSERTYLSAHPYKFDADPGSEVLWRLLFPGKERRILETIEMADRGARSKAFRIIESIVRMDGSLEGLTSYHLRTILFHSFDAEIDRSVRWQRMSVDSAFRHIVEQLQRCLRAGRLPHFFEPNFDLWANVPPQLMKRWRHRCEVLFGEGVEGERGGEGEAAMRVLRRRIEEASWH